MYLRVHVTHTVHVLYLVHLPGGLLATPSCLHLRRSPENTTLKEEGSTFEGGSKEVKEAKEGNSHDNIMDNMHDNMHDHACMTTPWTREVSEDPRACPRATM